MIFDSKTRDSKSIWQNINNLVNPSVTKRLIIPNVIRDGIVYDSPPVIADLFNDYFCEAASHLSSSINNPVASNLNYQSFLGASNPNSFFCSNVSLTELTNVVHGIKSSRTCIGNS